jgi:hypothetical protein
MAGLPRQYRFQRNSKGAIIPPQPLEGFGLVWACPLLLPLAVHFPVPYQTLSPHMIQFLPSLWALRRAHLVSDPSLALVELLVVAYLLARAIYFPFFRYRHLSRFTPLNPPPIEMAEGWPGLVAGELRIGGLSMAISTIAGPVMYFANALDPKYEFLILSTFGAGLLFLTEGLMNWGLFATFRSKFFCHHPFAPIVDS